MPEAESPQPPLPTVDVEYLPTGVPGDLATIRLEVSAADLERGHELWIRGVEEGPYKRLAETTTALEVIWKGDLQLLELVCFSPLSQRFFVCREYLRRQPTTGIHVQAADNAITYVAPPEAQTDLWQRQRLPGRAVGWRELPLPRAELVLDGPRRHDLLFLENGHGSPPKHVAVTFESELTVGRLHRGTERRLNQSQRGAHWHLGWQRITASAGRRGEGVTGDLMELARDWMSRSAGTVRMATQGETFHLEATSLGPSEEFQLHPRGPASWDLELSWSTYADSLRIHAAEATGQLADRNVELPWFWATRQGIAPHLEDRYFLWLPGWGGALAKLTGAGGWLGEEVRWLVGDGRLILIDAGAINGRS